MKGLFFYISESIPPSVGYIPKKYFKIFFAPLFLGNVSNPDVCEFTFIEFYTY